MHPSSSLQQADPQASTSAVLSKPYACFLLFITPFVLYAKSFKLGLLYYGDAIYYLHNDSLQHGQLQGLATIWKTTFYGNYFPITQLTLWIDLALFGTDQWWGARLHELLWFGIGTLAIHALINRLTKRPNIALITAALYAVHAINTSATLWLAGRKTLVCFALVFWALERYIASRQVRHASTRKANIYYGSALVLFVAALLSKSHAAILPCLIVLYECFFRTTFQVATTPEAQQNEQPRKTNIFKLALPVIPFAATACLYLALTGHFIPHDNSYPVLGGTRLGSVCSDGPIILSYARNMFIPTKTSFFYFAEDLSPGSIWGWGAWILALAAGVGSAYFSDYKKWILFGWLFGLIALSPKLNMTPQYNPILDLYGMWALPGWLLASVLVMESILNRFRISRKENVQAGLSILLIFTFGIISIKRASIFTSRYNLFEHAVELEPRSALARSNFAMLLSRGDHKNKQSIGGLASWQALRTADAHRIPPIIRTHLMVNAVVALKKADQETAAKALLRSEFKKYGPLLEPFRSVVKAMIANRTGNPKKAILLLNHLFLPVHKHAAQELRSACHTEDTFPFSIKPTIEFQRSKKGQRKTLSNAMLLSIQLLELCRAYLQAEDATRGLDVALVLTNLFPNQIPGRLALADAYVLLKKRELANRILKTIKQ